MPELPLDPYRFLLSQAGVDTLPIGTPLSLAQIPLVRPIHRQEKRGPDGRLPLDAYELRIQQRDASGVRREMVIQGSSTEGLPYGTDGEYLLGLFHLIAKHHYFDGEFHAPSLRQLCNALGREGKTHEILRAREALTRFASTKVTTRVIAVDPEKAAAVREGRAQPHLPSGRGITREKGITFHILDLAWRREYGRKEEGEDWIDYLRVNPMLIDQSIAGWIAWIDIEAYVALPQQPTARRLYEFMASEVALGRPTPWIYDLRELSTQLGITSGEPRHLLRRLLDAAEQLHRAGVLASCDHHSPRRGQYTLEIRPGPLLSVGRYLRGIGLQDLLETQVLLLLLAKAGISGTKAREIVHTQPEQAFWALAYLRYAEESFPSNQKLTNPAGFIVHSLKNHENLAADRGFLQWYETQVVEEVETVTEQIAFPLTPAPLPPAPAPAIECHDPDAQQVWDEIRPHLIEQATGKRAELALNVFHPVTLEGSTLVLGTRNSYLYEWAHEGYVDSLVVQLSEQSNGGVTNVRIELYPPN